MSTMVNLVDSKLQNNLTLFEAYRIICLNIVL